MSNKDQLSPTVSFSSNEVSITGDELEGEEATTRNSLSSVDISIDFTRESATITNSTAEHSYDEQYADRVLKEIEERQYESLNRPNVMSLFSQQQSTEDELLEESTQNLPEQVEEEKREIIERADRVDREQQNPIRELKQVGLSNRFANIERELLNDFFIYTPDQSQTGAQLSHTRSDIPKDSNQTKEAEFSDNSSIASSLDELVRTYEKRTRQQTEAIRQLQFEVANIKSFPSTPDPTRTEQVTMDDTLSQISRSAADASHTESNGTAVFNHNRFGDPTDDDESDLDFFFSDKGQMMEHNKSDDMTISSSFIVNVNDQVNREIPRGDMQKNQSQYVTSSPYQKATNGQMRPISILQDMLREEIGMRERETENKEDGSIKESETQSTKWTSDDISSSPTSQLPTSNEFAKWPSASPDRIHKIENDTRNLLTGVDGNTSSRPHFTITTHALSIPPSQEGTETEKLNRIRQLYSNVSLSASVTPVPEQHQHFQHLDLHFPAWIEFNEMLRVNGFIGVTEEDATDLDMFITVISNRLQDVLNSYDERGKMLENVTREKRQVQEIVDKYHAKVTELNQELQRHKAAALRRSELDSRARDRHNVNVNETISDLNGLVKRLKKEKEELKERLIQSEAELRFKAEEISQLQRKLDSKNAEEERRDKLARSIFQQHYKRSAANNRSDHREVSLISMYEEMRNKHLEQIRHLTSELQRKNDHNDGSGLISDLRKELHRMQEKFNKLQSEYAVSIRNSELKYAQTARFAKGLQKENEKLLEEIQARPSNEQYQKIVSELDTNRQTQSQQSTHNPVIEIPSHKWGPVNMPISPSREAARQPYTNETVVEIKKRFAEACSILNIANPDHFIPTLKKTAVVLSTIPKMEHFITAVCSVCSKGREELEKRNMEVTPKMVVPILSGWIKDLSELREMECAILSMMHGRKKAPAYNQGGSRSLLLDDVRSMIENENKLNAFKDDNDIHPQMYEKGTELTSKLIQHFQHLFDVPNMEGILPKMNDLYGKVQECQNAMSALNQILGLPFNASSSETLSLARRALAPGRCI